jgi:hypothetical protein
MSSYEIYFWEYFLLTLKIINSSQNTHTHTLLSIYIMKLLVVLLKDMLVMDFTHNMPAVLLCPPEGLYNSTMLFFFHVSCTL